MSFDLSRPGPRTVWLTVGLWLVGTLALAGLATPAAAQHPIGRPMSARPMAEPMWFGPIMGGPMMADPMARPTVGQSSSLQQLVNQLSDQFWYAYRSNIPVHRMCHGRLREVIEAWNQSPQTAADRQLMVQWLRDSIAAAMPGELKALPPVPEFSGSPTSAAPTAPESPAASAEPAAPAAPQSTTSNKPVVSDVPVEPMKAKADEQQDDWFNEAATAPPIDENMKESSDDNFWQTEPQTVQPTNGNSPDGNPFGDDPLGQ